MRSTVLEPGSGTFELRRRWHAGQAAPEDGAGRAPDAARRRPPAQPAGDRPVRPGRDDPATMASGVATG